MASKQELQIGYNRLRAIREQYDALRAKFNGKRPSNYKQLKEYADSLSWIVDQETRKAGFVSKKVLGKLPVITEAVPRLPEKKDLEKTGVEDSEETEGTADTEKQEEVVNGGTERSKEGVSNEGAEGQTTGDTESDGSGTKKGAAKSQPRKSGIKRKSGSNKRSPK